MTNIATRLTPRGRASGQHLTRIRLGLNRSTQQQQRCHPRSHPVGPSRRKLRCREGGNSLTRITARTDGSNLIVKVASRARCHSPDIGWIRQFWLVVSTSRRNNALRHWRRLARPERSDLPLGTLQLLNELRIWRIARNSRTPSERRLQENHASAAPSMISGDRYPARALVFPRGPSNPPNPRFKKHWDLPERPFQNALESSVAFTG
jgi:hypothetical protein